jgi:large subunit ribosomal protein L19
MNLIEKFEKQQIELSGKTAGIPNFGPGDTVRVNVKIVEGANERIQAYEGLCVARISRALSSSFTVRKISYGEGVERTFPLYSPRLESIVVVKRGIVRRAKLYYMRKLRGKAARIEENLER